MAVDQNMGIRMKRKELTKIYTIISNWKKFSIVYRNMSQRCQG